MEDAELLDWLADCWKHVRSSNGKHRLLLLPLDEQLGEELRIHCSALSSNQFLFPYELGESAIRPAMFSLRVLHEGRVMLAEGMAAVRTGRPLGFMRLFISHAKADGLPLARALKHLIDEVSWLEGFYDASDIPAGSDWEDKLQ